MINRAKLVIVILDLRSENQSFLVWVWLLVMCRGKPSAVIARLMPKCMLSRQKWYPFPFSPVIRECSWKKAQIGKKMVLVIVIIWSIPSSKLLFRDRNQNNWFTRFRKLLFWKFQIWVTGNFGYLWQIKWWIWWKIYCVLNKHAPKKKKWLRGN